MLKTYLLTPGPTPVPEPVALASAQPILHHRSAAFESLFGEVRQGLKWLFGTNEEVLTFTCSGAGAMEGAVANFLKRGDKVIVVDGGFFGERWAKICNAYGIEPITCKVEWGHAVRAEEVEELLTRYPEARAVMLQATEASTGVMHPVGEIAQLTRSRRDVITIVDACAAIGAYDVPMDALGIDVLISSSEYALMLPPGLAFGAASFKAWNRIDEADLPRFYFNWKHEREMQKQNQTGFMPAVSLLQGLGEVIRWLRGQGKDRVFARHERLARSVRDAMTALELPLFAERPSPALTAVVSPIDADQLVKVIRERYGVTLLGGQEPVKGKIFRIANMGWVDEHDVLAAISSVERGLVELGVSVQLGKGVSAAVKAFAGR